MRDARETFATQVDGGSLSEIRALAKTEGRQLQALVDEAFADLLEKRRNARARQHVLSAYQQSHDRFASLYQKLAKRPTI